MPVAAAKGASKPDRTHNIEACGKTIMPASIGTG